MKIGFLISFTYDGYCQGYEEMNETLLVYAESFDDACTKISYKRANPRNFKNLTLQ